MPTVLNIVKAEPAPVPPNEYDVRLSQVELDAIVTLFGALTGDACRTLLKVTNHQDVGIGDLQQIYYGLEQYLTPGRPIYLDVSVNVPSLGDYV